MTRERLSQYKYLQKEIEADTVRLAELRMDASDPKITKWTKTPKSKGFSSRVERYAVKIAQLEEVIEEKIEKCLEERLTLEKWIATIPDSLTRQIVTLRFVNGFSWIKVGSCLNVSPECACRIFERYIKKNK